MTLKLADLGTKISDDLGTSIRTSISFMFNRELK